jgi:tryptophan halogenase
LARGVDSARAGGDLRIMAEPVRDITIVGGGTSGWLAALFLATHFKRTIESGDLRIKLIESARVPIIGVGESLSPSMPATLRDLGISESAFIRATDATFKLAGYFRNWDVGFDGTSTSWVNPFVGYTTAGYEFERFELAGRRYGEAPDYARVMSPCREAIEQRKAPRQFGQPDYQHLLRYAYHTDAGKFAPFLREVAVSRGVESIIDDVGDIEVDERGFVASLMLEGRGELPVELVIDATGFSSIILHKKLGVKLLSYEGSLVNDRAVVAQLRHEDSDDIEPATRSTALGAGWAFRVPLYTRTGNGYIYSSKFTSDDEATREFLSYLGPAGEGLEPRVIPMRIGRAERTWVNNCVALGLSAGFVEPLEATAIYSVETSLKWLLNSFPDASFPPVLADRYSARTAALFDEIVDYIVLHYRLSNRSDTPYWRAQREEIKVPDTLAANLELWRHSLPVNGDLRTTSFFDKNTYVAALFGKGFYKGGELRPGRQPDPAEWRNLKQTITQAHGKALAALPSHKALLTAIRAGDHGLVKAAVRPTSELRPGRAA